MGRAARRVRIGGHAESVPELAAPVGLRDGTVDGADELHAAQEYTSVGAQADLRFSVLHWYDMTLSVGYAVGYQGTQRAGTEWMVSLKIM